MQLFHSYAFLDTPSSPSSMHKENHDIFCILLEHTDQSKINRICSCSDNLHFTVIGLQHVIGVAQKRHRDIILKTSGIINILQTFLDKYVSPGNHFLTCNSAIDT